ncbi:MAG: Na+/H+ antiporter NhaC family protein [Bacteroidales bacterium]|nr:Na+/H+ antiporter NhaC family protein [Bacteroidales bacterium]
MQDNIEKTESQPDSTRLPHPLVSLVPALVLVGLLLLSNLLFEGDTLGGSSQLSLLVSAGVCIGLSMAVYKTRWQVFESALKTTFSDTSVSLVVLLLIGMMAAAWMVSGVVPTLIYYGIQILSPRFFLVASCVICAVVSLLTGSSWSTIATIGVALLGVGKAIGVPVSWSAGAIISGAYFGDKISPLSDTTILASSCTGTDLFSHIHYMLFTTVPSFVLTLTVFLCVGLALAGSGQVDVTAYLDGLQHTYHISLWTLLVPVITTWLIVKRLNALITLFLSALIAGVFALVFQPHILTAIACGGEVAGVGSAGELVRGLMTTFFASTSVQTGFDGLDSLVRTGGMSGMLNTVWLIMCAFCFGSAMVASGMLRGLLVSLVRIIKGTFGLVASTVVTGVVMNLTTGDQYMSIILTTNFFRDIYKEKGFESRLLSRTTEDAVTVTSVLIPWNSCGMTQATVLGVSTLTYLPTCIFNLASPLMSMLVAAIGWRITRESTVVERPK